MDDETHLRLVEAVTDGFERGETPASMAQRLYPDDKRARKALRTRIRKMTYHDALLAERVAVRGRGMMLVGLLPAIQALQRRVASGRVDAIKLYLEASGFHNPRVQHEHSGEITFKVDIPRPKFVDATAVEDAEVLPPAE